MIIPGSHKERAAQFPREGPYPFRSRHICTLSRISGNAASDKNIKDGVCAQIEKNFARAKWKVRLGWLFPWTDLKSAFWHPVSGLHHTQAFLHPLYGLRYYLK